MIMIKEDLLRTAALLAVVESTIRPDSLMFCGYMGQIYRLTKILLRNFDAPYAMRIWGLC